MDVFRGFSIFGIFAVNIVIMNSTFLNQDEFAKQWTSNIDLVSERILQLFFYTKFFPIFSLLFGLGISMQAIKLFDKNKFSFSFFARRMFVLFIFGIFHIVFLWSGDVLNFYAVLGLFTVFMMKRSNKIILVLAAVLLLFPFYDQVFGYFFNLINFQPETFLSGYTGETVNQIIINGTYVEGMKLRLLEYVSNIPMVLGFFAPIATSMFLLGLYLGKNKIHESLEVFIQQIKKPMLLIAVLTNSYRLVFLFLLPNFEIYSAENFRDIFFKLMILSDITMGLFYLWAIGWLWYNTKLKNLLSVLQYVGKMALTNYILQSFIGLFLFSSVGFRLYETMSPTVTLLTAFTVFLFQIVFSKIWLAYYRFGPLEWVWRCFTYKKLLPNRKTEI